MKINIEVVLLVNEARSLQRGTFPVNSRRFTEDSDKEAAAVAFEWIRKLRRLSGYFAEASIVKVTYEEKDITELVKTLEGVQQ
ncbi:hypothetical protein V1498_06915 [Peribacillus sp. SCS-26]|uniref:hypothetical protein n=1 Tax=Paraperibacillus marinus TaxID=3115295 RepID=UPI0039062AF1